jgi:hypothetical protein
VNAFGRLSAYNIVYSIAMALLIARQISSFVFKPDD